MRECRPPQEGGRQRAEARELLRLHRLLLLEEAAMEVDICRCARGRCAHAPCLAAMLLV
jgi:hypothetical protein